jgi:hypothetical protein
MKVSVILPVYNEFHTFNQVLERVRQAPLPQGCTRRGISERALPSAPAFSWHPATSC